MKEKQIDFALRNPKHIKKIESYELPSDSDLLEQEILGITCETCYLNEHCNRVSCLLPKGVKRDTVGNALYKMQLMMQRKDKDYVKMVL